MNEKLSGLLVKLRKEKGITQKDLADALNISDKAISRWETGSSSPNLDMIFRISQFYKVPYNDLVAARVATEKNGDVLVQEIIQEFSETNKRNSKRLKYVLIFAIIITLILAIAIIFTNTFNRFKVYRVDVDSNEFTFVKGIYIETRIKDTLFLNGIKIRNVNIKDTDTVSVDIYYVKNKKEHILQSYSSLERINLTNTQSYIKFDDLSDYFDNLYLRVIIINNKNEISTYETKLNFILDFSNNKVFYNEATEIVAAEINRFNLDNVESILLNNGFEYVSNNILRKKSDNKKISYFINSEKLTYSYDDNDFNYRYVYCLENNILEVSVFYKNNTEIENYKYDVNNDKVIECKTGSCNNFRLILKELDKVILYLFKN